MVPRRRRPRRRPDPRRRLPRRSRRRARLPRADRRPRPLRSALCALRPARVRPQHAPPRSAGELLGGAALQGRAGRPDAPPGHLRPILRRRPVMGRDARNGARARPPARPARVGRRRLAGEHPALGGGGEPAARRPAARGAGDADPPRGGRDDRLARVRDGGARLLRPSPLPDPVARLRRPELRADGGRPDRVPHDERAERVPLHRLAEDVGHHRPAARDLDAHAPPLRAPRRGDAACRRADPRAYPGRAVDDLRGVGHMPHVEEPEEFLETVEAFLRATD